MTSRDVTVAVLRMCLYKNRIFTLHVQPLAVYCHKLLKNAQKRKTVFILFFALSSESLLTQPTIWYRCKSDTIVIYNYIEATQDYQRYYNYLTMIV